ncbi:hypothetical protein J6590_085082 [Homalodisca vitripennis]|nr:hypothetical protein J6590_085082 [Homalodisca vitripennis]
MYVEPIFLGVTQPSSHSELAVPSLMMEARSSDVVPHKNYTGSWDNDIAVVKLNKPIKFGKNAKPIKLGTKNIEAGTKGLIAGWGESSESAESSPVLLDTTLTVYDWEKCQNTYPDDVTPRQICTYDTKTGPCVVLPHSPASSFSICQNKSSFLCIKIALSSKRITYGNG